jgi:hypothetical protein
MVLEQGRADLYYWVAVAPGPLRLSVDIPAHWQNEGNYRTELRCGGQSNGFSDPAAMSPGLPFRSVAALAIRRCGATSGRV